MVWKIGMVSLGCAKNLVDSEIMLGLLKQDGYEITNHEKEAEVLIVNTCAFIKEAKEESIRTILELARQKESGRCRLLLVTGCLPQRYGQELLTELPEIDGIAGTGVAPQIVSIVKQAVTGERLQEIKEPGYKYYFNLPRIQSTPHYSAYVKIADGCDNHCSFCTVPKLRGNYCSRPIASIVTEVSAMANRGVREVILVAQDTTSYGEDLYGKYCLDELLKILAAIGGIYWIRLLYCHPSHLTTELIEVIAKEPKICRYLDLPLQHVSSKILKRMNRQGSKDYFLELIHKLRQEIPGLTLRTTFLVGFPGETEEEFQELLDFMNEVRFDRVGAFMYSREGGTSAANMPGQVAEEIKKIRYEQIMALQKRISLENNQTRVGNRIFVLTEGEVLDEPGVFYGRSEGDAPEVDGKVYFRNTKSNYNPQPGKMEKVLITRAHPYDLEGELE